ncbi:MAG: hypothetical protein UX21_C0008G0007 [Microgenomates group bacterium GW2011_GWC2_45_8]|nr:MAG: hypothetical protein UX21_C0008G0007 [Microgenomates group bacterium GW2011_GWC2_45_8]KKU26228.1 MAG: hypothetical protein UX37_C0004G0023 [Microgenomates group bacterium GW2011_GWA2_46_16]
MKRHFLQVLFLLFFSLWSLRSIFHRGFMYSHDSLWHVERIQNIYSLIPTQFPVRWSPTLDNGYGVPLFNFTYPAPYYLGAGFMALGLGPIKSYDLILLLAYFLGGVGVYLLGRRRSWVGLTAAILYLTTPYQFLDIFVRGALGEVFALGLIPWVFLTFAQISTTGKLRWYSPLPFALLILSHNFYVYLFGALLTFFILVMYKHKRELIYVLFLSIGLSAFFLVPAFFEKNLLLFSQSNHLGYRDHFVYPLQLLYGKWNYLGSITGDNPYEMTYQLGASNLVILLFSLVVISLQTIHRSLSRKLVWSFIVLLLGIYMMLPISDFLWGTIPLLPSIQFPWRFLGITTIIFPLLYLELSIYFSKKNRFNLFPIVSGCLVILSIYASRNYGRPTYWMNADQFLQYHYEYAGKTTTAQRAEIVPRWAPVERYNADLIPEVTAGKITNYLITPLSISFDIDTSDSQSIVIERNYFPTWVGEIDGHPLALSPSSTGTISVPISSGTHSYRIHYQNTWVEKLGNLLSVLFVIALLGLLIKQYQSPNG